MPSYNLPDPNLPEETKDEMGQWLYDEITRTKNSLQRLIIEWENIEERYQQTELKEKKDFPFKDASHLMIAITPTYVEQIKAKILNTIFAPSDPFSVKPTRKDFIPFVKPMRSFLTWATREELKLKEVCDKSLLLEWIKLGTVVAKTIYTQHEESRYYWEGDDDGIEGEWVEYLDTLKDHPEVIPVSLEDYFFAPEARTQDEMEWEAHRFRISENELQDKKENRNWKNVDDLVKGHMQVHFDGIEEVRADEHKTKPDFFEGYRFFEVWFRYLVKGKLLRFKGIFHYETKTFMRLGYNDFPLQLTPFVISAYEPVEHRVHGTGVGKMCLATQLEVSVMHNQRLDHGSMSNSGVFKRRADSIVPDDFVLQLGSSVPVDEPDDLLPLDMGSQFDSTLQDEQHTISLLQQRLGMQDYLTQEGANAAQATTALAIMAESTRRFDLTLGRFRDFLSEVIMKVLLLYQKYYPEGKTTLILGEDGQWTEMVWQFPEKAIRDGLGIQVTATTSTTSKELERQNKLSLFGMVTQYYGQLTQYLLQAENPQLPVTVRVALLQIVDGLSTLVLDILQDYNLYQAEEIAISIEEIQERARQIEASPGIPGVTESAGVEAVPGAPGAAPPGQGEAAPQVQ